MPRLACVTNPSCERSAPPPPRFSYDINLERSKSSPPPPSSPGCFCYNKLLYMPLYSGILNSVGPLGTFGLTGLSSSLIILSMKSMVVVRSWFFRADTYIRFALFRGLYWFWDGFCSPPKGGTGLASLASVARMKSSICGPSWALP